MHLEREQEAWLSGEQGPSLQWAMEVLVDLARKTGADRMVPVASVHIPDWCGGPEEAWSGLKSLTLRSPIPVTANPSTGQCDELRKNLLERLRPGRQYSFSCVPYLSGNHPGKGQHIAWGGRAAVAFANSVLRARSEMESFETAAASAITGLTSMRGLHLEENRRPTIAVQLPRTGVHDHALLGWTLSCELHDEVPVLCGARSTFDEAKRLAFAINSRGSMPLFMLSRNPVPPAGLEAIEVVPELPSPGPEPDLAVMGCPHLSEQGINRWAKRLAGRAPTSTEAWFFTSRLCMDKCPIFGAVLRSRGSIFVDTCPLGMAHMMSGRSVACDSPALAECLRDRGIEAFYSPDEELLTYLAR
jgi:predicted aconitase